jgi:hypothetical protein
LVIGSETHIGITAMADPKTRTVGIIPVTKVKTQDAWKAYHAAATAFAEAKDKASAAKTAMKESFKRTIPALRDIGDFDFTVQGDKITVFENLAKTSTRARARDLTIG